MYSSTVLVCFVAVFAVCVEGWSLRAPFPNYITKCSRRDVNINNCIVTNANKAIPKLVKGDPYYKIPSMVPLKVPKVILQDDNELHLVLKNVEVYGLENTVMKNANMNFQNNKLDYNLTNPKVTILGDYEMEGHLLKEAINGGGRANITIVNGRYQHQIVFARYDNKILTSTLSYKPSRINYNFNNLYRGNEFHGYQTNVFLNNNWKEINKSFQRRASRAMDDFLRQLYKNLSIVLPVNEIFTY